MKISSNDLVFKAEKIKGFFGKELLNMKNSSVKLVKIAPLSNYPEHLHPEKTEYAYVLKGNLEFKIDSAIFYGEKGDFLIFEKNKKHSITNNTESECLLLIGAIAEN